MVNEKEENLEKMRHSASHVLAHAVLKLYPDAKLGIGPAIDNGFYYDFDMSHRLSPDDFPAIEAEMAKLVGANFPFERIEVARDKAAALLAGQKYKLERLAD